MESLQKQLNSQTSNPEALDKLQKDLEKLQEAAKSLADKTGDAADAERQKLSANCRCRSRRLSQHAVAQLDKPSPPSRRAMIAHEGPRRRHDRYRKLRDEEQARRDKPGRRKLAKIAEQLKNSPAEAAAATLKKLSEQLKSAKLSTEQQQKILRGV
jgi:ElaB/YqjD/DUF883 family membrane-anchored ribosome-binding protein